MGVPLILVDAFTDRPFGGNPAAVCLLDTEQGEPGAGWMRSVASELDFPATAFVRRVAPGTVDADYSLRWFTSTGELELCGHGTLAAAHALYAEGRVPAGSSASFWTRSGRLTARRLDAAEGAGGVLAGAGDRAGATGSRKGGDWIELDFPVEAAAPVDQPPLELLPALGLGSASSRAAETAVVFVGRNRLDYLVELETAESVQALAPDLGRLREVQTRGVIVTAAVGRSERELYGGAHFVSRFFAPRTGIDEDPVTGSAHCCLGPYWAAALGRERLLGRQLSQRGGTIGVTVRNDRVGLAGQAVTVLRGTLTA
ncbi:MAG: Phenazine biosynthesis protein PhzF like [uncultured Chloroflexi bacterium]|uniref:Phenazine biosynthesis protein PhzF like n=1 Tax=uncultured Chloroflexota bacterium TaxID=166587 RepID=A0A6J4JPQ4_9CHLR|nr:MAG: Phenazine biosynthesis protein PhzF like [uncultured Chloroflexota bacterium]